MTESVRVLVVDDDALVRSAIAMILGSATGIEVLGGAGDGAEALAAVDRYAPDVVLMTSGCLGSTASPPPNCFGLDSASATVSGPVIARKRTTPAPTHGGFARTCPRH